MDELWNWIILNKEWIFDGIGVLLVGSLITFITFLVRRKNTAEKSQTQVGGDNSVNIQSAGNITINKQGRNSNGRRTKTTRRG